MHCSLCWCVVVSKVLSIFFWKLNQKSVAVDSRLIKTVYLCVFSRSDVFLDDNLVNQVRRWHTFVNQMIASNVIDQIRCSRVLFIQILLQQVPLGIVDDVRLIRDVASELQIFLFIHFGDLLVDIRVLLLVNKLPLVCACIEYLKWKETREEWKIVCEWLGQDNEWAWKQVCP